MVAYYRIICNPYAKVVMHLKQLSKMDGQKKMVRSSTTVMISQCLGDERGAGHGIQRVFPTFAQMFLRVQEAYRRVHPETKVWGGGRKNSRPKWEREV
jgi:hypothetical protein